MRSKKNRNSKHLEIINKIGNCSFQDFEDNEKRFLESFRYYNIELKPFCIQKFHKLPNNTECHHTINNKLVEKRIKSRIFKISKEPRKSKNLCYEDANCLNVAVQGKEGIFSGKSHCNQILRDFVPNSSSTLFPSITNNNNNNLLAYPAQAPGAFFGYPELQSQMQQMMWNEYYTANLILLQNQISGYFLANILGNVPPSESP